MLSTSVKRVLPGFSLSLGSSLLFTCIILLLPMTALVMQLAGMSWQEYWQVVTHPQVVAAYRVTLLSAAIASVFNGAFGMLMAWVLTRYRFPGRNLLDGLMDLPFALPTAVAGLTLASLFSTTGWYGQWLAPLGIKVSFTWLGIAVAMAFTSIPFVVRTVQPVLEELGPEYEEAAQTLGASPWQSFRRVILPEVGPALTTGVVLSFTRSLGEFGAVIFIAGNIAWQTEVTSLMIFIRLQEFNYAAASAIASVILAASLVLLFIANVLQSRYGKRVGGH
ncbi:sulfate/thiosulfate ABC transporter permease CysT [Leminorella richardii]|uniref:sulfate/thiosulfate ABC transporter permease CysT n=1 Tax=Leminorella richardii TaxID=158841 RepID=UPI000DBE7B95|nr:sulfate/thiosulfate ABC transporter permease CysT [Leminorella richardii]